MDKRYYEANKTLLNNKKKKCCICGEDTFCCLEVHHLRNKLYNISQAVKYLPTELFKEELDKCIVVCANCHKKLHNNIINYGKQEILEN